MSNQHELEHPTVPIRRRVYSLKPPLHRHTHTQASSSAYSICLTTRPADHCAYEPQINDMLSGGPALSGRSTLELEQIGDTNHPVEAPDGEDKAVTVTSMASAMATDRAAEGEAGEAKV